MDIIKICNSNEIKISKLPPSIEKHCKTISNKKQQAISKKAWCLLSKYIDLTNVYFSKKSKPLSRIKNQYFSLSHSIDKIAIAISNKPIGIDIQEIIGDKLCNSLSNKYLDKNNLVKFKRSKNKQLWFTRLWAKCESYIKLNDLDLNPKLLNKKFNCKFKIKRIDNYIFALAKK